MPIGPIVPGSYVDVTQDSPPPGKYALVQAPSATMPVVGADLQALTLVVLNSIELFPIATVNHYSQVNDLDIDGGSDPLGTAANTGYVDFTPGGAHEAPNVIVEATEAGDILDIAFSGTAEITGSAVIGTLRIVAVEDFGGANTVRVVRGGRAELTGPATIRVPISIHVRRIIATPGDAKVKVQGKADANSIILVAAYSLTVTHLRPL